MWNTCFSQLYAVNLKYLQLQNVGHIVAHNITTTGEDGVENKTLISIFGMSNTPQEHKTPRMTSKNYQRSHMAGCG